MADGKSLAIRLSVNSGEAKAQLESLSQQGGQSLDRLAEKLRALGTASASGAAGLGQAANNNARGLASLGEAAERLESRVKGVNRGVNDVRGTLELIGGPLANVSQGMGDLTATIGNVSDVFGVLSNLLVRSPLGAAAVAISAAAAAFALFRDRTLETVKAQEELAKVLAQANELLDTQAERTARLAQQKLEETRLATAKALDAARDDLAKGQSELDRMRAANAAPRARGEQAPFDLGEIADRQRAIDLLIGKIAELDAAQKRLADPAALGASRDAASKAADEQAKAYEAVRQRIDGVHAANARFSEGMALVSQRYREGAIEAAEYRKVVAQLVKTRDDEISKADGSAAARAKEADDLRRLNEQTLRDVEAYVKAHDKRERGLESFIAKLEEEARLAGETNAVRAEGAALLEAQNRLVDEQGRKVRDLTEAEKQRISTAAKQKSALEEQRQAAEKFAKDMERTIVRSTDRAVDFAADTLYDAFTGRISSVGEFLKTTLLRAAAQAAAEMVFRPLIAPIVSAGVQAVAASGFGAALGVGGSPSGVGVGSAAGAAAGAAGIGYQVSNAGGFWNALGNPFGFGLPAAQAASAAAPFSYGSAAFLPAGEIAASGLGASAFVPAGEVAASGGALAAGSSGIGSALAAIAPYATIAGGLFSAYNFAQNPNVVNGLSAAGGLYAATSAGLGLAGFSALPLAGPVGIAAAAIGILGSLFGGGGKKEVVHADQTRRAIQFNADGSVQDLGGPTGWYGASPARYDYLNDVGSVVRKMIGELGGTAPTFQLVGSYDSIAWPGGRGRVDTLDGRVDIEATTDPQTMAFRAFKALLPLSAGIDAVTAAVARNSTAEKLEDLAKDLDFAKTLQDTVAAVGDLGSSLDKLKTQAKAAAASMVASLSEIETRADALGVGDLADASIAKQIRAWMGAQGPQIQPSATQAALAQIEGAFAGLGEAGAKYGITAAETTAARTAAIQKVRDQFNDTIAAILDPTSAALANFDKSADQMRKDAQALGADMVATEKAIARQRQQILDQQLGGLATSVRAFLDGQAVGDISSLSPAGRLAAAQGQFDAALTGARAGDSYQSSRLVASAQELLAQGRAYYGSTADYATLETFTRAQLQNLGSQQGWAGFPAAVQSQTQALVNAQQLSTAALVAKLDELRSKLADVELELARQRMRSLAA